MGTHLHRYVNSHFGGSRFGGNPNRIRAAHQPAALPAVTPARPWPVFPHVGIHVGRRPAAGSSRGLV